MLFFSSRRFAANYYSISIDRFKSGYDENFEQVFPSCIVYYNFELDAKM